MSTPDVMRKIRALLESAGRTEAEAYSAIAMAEKLMAKHGLTLEQIEAAGDDEFRTGGTRAGTNRRSHEVIYCTSAIGGLTGTRVWRDMNVTPTQIRFFGLDQDVTFAEWLLEMLRETMEREWQTYLASPKRPQNVHGRTLRKSFMIGMARRINDRLGEMAAERVEATPKGRDLVVAKRALVERKFGELGIHLRSSAKTTFYRNSAYEAGHAAGGRVNFSRPVGSQSSVKGYLR